MNPCRKCRHNLSTQIGFRMHLIVCRIPQNRWNDEYARWSETHAVSTGASVPGSGTLPDAADAGVSSPVGTAPDNQTIYLDGEECPDCSWTGKSVAKHRAKAHREVVA